MDQFTGANGERRPIHIWETEEPKAILLALHGGMAHAGDYVTPALYLMPKGYTTVAYGMRGHVGQRRIYIDSFDDFLEDLEIFVGWVQQTYPGVPIVLLSHSMGALVAAHYYLKAYPGSREFVGCIMSSPYFANALKVPALMQSFAKVFSTIAPRMKVPLEDLATVLTHDEEITQRHIEDRDSDTRAREPSVRFAYELMVAQQYVQESFSRWNDPLLLIVAGDEHLADPQVTLALAKEVDPSLIEQHYYPDNFHENFNEVNREESFELMVDWIEKRLA